MATVLTPFDIGGSDSSQQKQSQGTVPTFNATPMTAGGGGVSTPGTGSTSPIQGAKPSNAPTATSSGGFQNIQKYLGANQDFNASKGGLAGELNTNVQGQANQANSALQGAFNQFNQQANQASSGFNNPVQNQQTLDSILTIPATMTGDQSQQVKSLINANYQGPTQINPQDLSTIKQQNLGNLQNLGQDTQSESGRFNLLGQMFGKTGYSQGQKSLDNLFLQNNPDQSQQLKGLQNIANKFSQNVNNTEQQAQNTVQQQSDAAQNAQQQAKQAVNNTITTQQQGYQDALAKAQAQRTADYQDIYNRAGTNNLSPEMAKQLGLKSGENLYGLSAQDIQGAISQGSPLSIGQVATPQDINTLNNLYGLLGQTNTFLNSTQAPGSVANYNNLAPVVAQRQADYNNAMNSGVIPGFNLTPQQFLNQWSSGQSGGWMLNPANAQPTLDFINAIQQKYGQHGYTFGPGAAVVGSGSNAPTVGVSAAQDSPFLPVGTAIGSPTSGVIHTPTGAGMTKEQQDADRAEQLLADQKAQAAAAQQAALDAATAQKAAIGQQTTRPGGLGGKLGTIMRGGADMNDEPVAATPAPIPAPAPVPIAAPVPATNYAVSPFKKLGTLVRPGGIR